MKNLLIAGFYLTIFSIFPVFAEAATLSLSPSSGTFNKNCPFTLDINLDTDGLDSDGTDAILVYDSSRFTGVSINTELAPKIYSDYPGSNIDDTSGKITVSGLASVTTPYNGKGTLAKVSFLVKDTAPLGATQIKFDFDPNDKSKTTDSNVVQRGTIADILSSVVNGNYVVGTGTCASPTPGPGRGAVSPGATATPSASVSPNPTLPPGGTQQLTMTLTIVGLTLTVLGVLGLVFL